MGIHRSVLPISLNLLLTKRNVESDFLMVDVNDITEFLNIIRNNDVYIYGAGFVAQNFYRCLKRLGLDERVMAFVTTENANRIIAGKDVILFEQIHCFDNTFFCIAVHESVKDEIIMSLKKRGIQNYVWVSPFLNDLFLGNPIEKQKTIQVGLIVNRNLFDYSFAIRFLAIEQFYEKNNVGYAIYLKAQKMHCENATAARRLENFINLIESCSRHGLMQNTCISVLSNLEIVDGWHRTSLACYLGQEEIKCNVYSSKVDTFELEREKFIVRVNLEDLKNGEFSIEEIELLEKTRQKIEALYK